MTVVPELRGYTDKQNKKFVYIRISENGKRKYKKTNIKVEKTQWDGRVKSNHPQHALFNTIIKKLILEAEVNLFTNKYPDADLYKYCTKCLNEWDKIKASETIRQHASEINNLKAFSPSVRISNISPEWLNRYKAFCFGNKNATNTVHKHLKFVRLIVRKAHKERLIEQNPFDIFEMPKYRDPQKKYLTREQVEQIDKFCLVENCPKDLKQAGTWFVIACITALRFQDLKNFKKSNIKNNRLVTYTSKTGEVVSMPLSIKLKALFERIGYKPLDYVNVHYNRLLKAIAASLGIDENISSHTARHTAAISWANAGISQEVVAKLMGHQSLKTSSIYFKITGVRVDEELKKLEQKEPVIKITG